MTPRAPAIPDRIIHFLSADESRKDFADREPKAQPTVERKASGPIEAPDSNAMRQDNNLNGDAAKSGCDAIPQKKCQVL